MNKVSVRYGNEYLLKEVSWTIREGESWALLGPNGAGKTTLLNLLCGDHPQAYQNDIEIFARRRGFGESIWEIKHQIGFVSPELHLHFPDELNCFDVVASGFFDAIGLWEPLKRTQRVQTLHLLKQLGLERLAQQPLCALSTGRQRMALLARALVKKPRLLVLDEPCQGLDQANRTLFLRTLNELLASHLTTMIYVTHRNEEIPKTIKRVLRLKAGKVVEA